ncbi:MAG: hypothetical protein Q7J67_00625 [bacterium]|nr:hypothetical protein [bacterium]
MAGFCPFCNDEIKEEILLEWVEGFPVDFEFVCPTCGESLKITLERGPVFSVKKK